MNIADDYEPTMSPLCQSIERDGKSVRVDIYDNGEGGWILDVVDEFGNSVVWDYRFPTDQDALDDVLSVIKNEGFDAYYSPFGWYKEFELKCKGHPLSELSRDISSGESKTNSKIKLRNK